MPKTNFTKVEEVLEQGLRKYSAEHLLEQADEASSSHPKSRNPTIAYASDAEKTKTSPLTKDQNQLIHSLQRDVKNLQKKGKGMYSKLGIGKTDLRKMIDNPKELSPEDWKKIQQIREKIDQYKSELMKQLPQQSDEEIVESERKDHVNRRYNVNKKWLPLT
ncbi:MAG: hypothetical protein LLG04_16165 [Parachlamydia sp.]|nr:hypothetical protein [Parachlamydia sp.]